MSVAALDNLIACQAALIAALDGRDAAAIERATSMLADATGKLQHADMRVDETAARKRIDHGLKQVTAAKIRVNALSYWTRQRIDRMAELRGKPMSSNYNIMTKY